jgi:hypothetical protein
VKITGPTKTLTTFYKLILLKADIEYEETGNDEFTFELTVDKNLNNQNDH